MTPTHTAAGPVSPECLPDDLATLKGMIVELVASLQQRDRDYEALRHRLDLLLKRLYGPRGERYDPNQPWLFADLAAPPEGPTAAAEPAGPGRPKRRARPHGRRRLPPQLPREVRHHVLSEAERLCAGCGHLRIDIGVDRSEQLDYRPASLLVIEHFVHKYVCPRCSKRPAGQESPTDPEAVAMPSAPPEPEPPPAAESAPLAPGPDAQPPATARQSADPGAAVVAASKPAQPIAKGLPAPGLLAHLIVSKYVDHLPLHRLERIYERDGVFLPRSTLCDWLAACAGLLGPLYQRLVGVVLLSRALHTDDTPVKMQEPATHLWSTARFWVYLGDAAHPYNVYDFTVNRKRDGPQQFLANYQGYLHADAFSGYDRLYLPEAVTGQPRIIEVACNAHARRKFYEARPSDAVRSHQALAYYGQLYELERSAHRLEFNDAQRMQMRQELSVPILETFRRWLEAERDQVLPKSPLGEAIGYALNNWAALVRYTEAGFLAIDNNVAEREMKRVAIGRKNWLFVGSPQGGRTAAVLLSFTSTCNRLGVEPWAYLQDVLSRLPTTSASQLDELVPDRWQAARAATAKENGPSAS
ncbi:MAG: IS66 family transposase [Planctomycetes bacterium]|nr:IS66 family transposase [Planctomycetota bacterium]